MGDRKSLIKAAPFRAEFFVIFIAFAIALNSQFAAFTDKYVLNGDVFQSIYWMQQFRDSELFRNDLLTDYAKEFHSPWGFFLLYRALSVIIDPLIISKILPLVLFPLFSLYMFKLVRHFTDNYTAFLAAFLSIITPAFLVYMVGGHPRSFGFPFLIAFLYYLVKKEHGKASLFLVAQSLFYPMLFFVAALAYGLILITSFENWRTGLFVGRKVTFFVLAVAASGMILLAKYVVSYNPNVGTTVDYSQMVNRPEFYGNGRAEILPTQPLEKVIPGLAAYPFMSIITKYPASIRQINKGLLNAQTVPLILRVLLLLMLIFLALQVIRRKLTIPKELLYLFLAGVIMYAVADLLMFKLYQPIRYVQYVVPLISVVVASIIIGHLITRLGSAKVKMVLKTMLIVFFAFHFNINKDVGLRDYAVYQYGDNLSFSKELFEYLRGVPKDAMIAAHPYLADGIPTFSGRKVFINAELSHPWFDNYWKTIKMRTLEFFDAYYSTDASEVYAFCDKHGIDYLVVDRLHFAEDHLTQKRTYFEPFDAYVKDLTRNRRNYALLNIPERDALFTDGSIFVISTDILKSM